LLIACDAPKCVRGLVHLADGFADPCKVCGGLGWFTPGGLARRIGENEDTFTRFMRNRRMRPKTTARICAKLVELVSAKPAGILCGPVGHGIDKDPYAKAWSGR